MWLKWLSVCFMLWSKREESRPAWAPSATDIKLQPPASHNTTQTLPPVFILLLKSTIHVFDPTQCVHLIPHNPCVRSLVLRGDTLITKHVHYLFFSVLQGVVTCCRVPLDRHYCYNPAQTVWSWRPAGAKTFTMFPSPSSTCTPHHTT